MPVRRVALMPVLVLLSLLPALGQQTARQLIGEAGQRRAQAQFAEAIRLYQEALPLCITVSEKAQAWFGLASVYRQQGDNPRAVQAYAEVTCEPGIASTLKVSAWRQMVSLHTEEGDLTRAEAAYEELLAAFPDDADLQVDVTLDLARLEAADDRPADAVERLRKLLVAQPKSPRAPEVWVALVQAQTIAEDFAGATTSAREGWEAFPEHTMIVLALLDGLRESDRAPQAIPLGWEAVARAPEDDNLFRALADLHRATDSIAQLAAWLEQQSRETAHAALWLRRLAQLHTEEDDDAEALSAYERLLALAPTDPEVLREAGAAALRAGELAKGEKWLRECLALAPEDVSVVMSLGEVYLRQGQPAEALRFWKEGLQYRPDDRASVQQLGNALQRHQLHQQALTIYAEARQALNDPRAFSAQVGQAHEALLDFPGATREYVAALADAGTRGPGMAGLRLQDLIEDTAARPEVRATLQELAATGKLPPDAAAALLYARILDGENPDAALAALPAGDDPAQLGLLARLGHKLEIGGQWRSAALAYGRMLPALTAPTDRAVLALHVGELLGRSGDWQAALAALEQAPQEALPGELARRLGVEQAELLLREGHQPARAREPFTAASAGRDPLALRARWGLADCAFALGEYESAREQYAALLSVAPPPIEAAEGLPPLVVGSFYLPFDEDGALLQRWPGEDYVAFRTAEMFFREGKLREADAAFREVSKRYPASPYANDALERVLLLPALERNAPGGEAYREAVQAFDRGDGKLAGELLASVKASPLAEPALLLLADVQLWQGDKAAALETLEALAKDYPDSSCAAVALLRHAGLRMADDPVAARLQLQEVVRRFPDAPQAAEARILLQMLQQAHREPQP